MMKEEGCVNDEGWGDGLGLEDGGQQELHHSNGADFIMPKGGHPGRQARREERWRETLNAVHVTPV